jgi:haloacid dehalogenase superfamily, subfamily IA, variant 3 with third motif having DD or ED
MKRIRCLMLDMGGVLTKEQDLGKVAELQALLGSKHKLEDFRPLYFGLRSDYDQGRIDGPEYWRRVAAELGLSEPGPERLASLITTDLASWFSMRESMLEFIGGARLKVARLVLLSNIHEDGVRYLREGPGRAWTGAFHELILSCEHNLVKPDRAIYELAVEKSGVSPADTLFVDDFQINVDGAHAAGLSSFRFVSEEDFFARLQSEYELVL